MLTIDIAEISFQQTGDLAGLTNVTVTMMSLSLIRVSSGCQPKQKLDGPKALFFSDMTDLEIFWLLIVMLTCKTTVKHGMIGLAS